MTADFGQSMPPEPVGEAVPRHEGETVWRAEAEQLAAHADALTARAVAAEAERDRLRNGIEKLCDESHLTVVFDGTRERVIKEADLRALLAPVGSHETEPET